MTDPRVSTATANQRRDWLLMLAILSAILLAAVYVVAVRTAWGQNLDDAALDGRTSRPEVLHATGRLLDTISVSSLVLLGGAVVAIAAARRRVRLALVAVTVVAGAIMTSEILKRVVLARPALGSTDPLPVPSFPSGHSTIAMSLAIAFVLVVPARARIVTALGGVAYACLVGAGTVTAGWHRPSDVMGGFLVVTMWVGVVAAILIRWRGATADRESERVGQPIVSPTLAWAGAVLLAVGFAGFVIVYLAIRHGRLAAVRLDGAYAASLVAIAGVGLVLMAGVVAALRGLVLDAPAAASIRSGGALRGTAPPTR